MQTSSCFLFCLFCMLLVKNLDCKKIKNNRKIAEDTHHSATRGNRDAKNSKDDTGLQDIEVRAILIRCPEEKENEAYHKNPKSIANISSIRAQAILQFPGFDSDEATYQSNVAKCRKKIVINLRIRNSGKKSPEDQYIVVDHVFDQLTGMKARLLNAYVLKIKQDPSFEMYNLKFMNVVNGEATEEVITKETSNYTGCDDTSDKPTCGFAYYKDEQVPFSQGFCCSCDASVNGERQPGCHHAPRNGSLNGWKPDESFRQTDKAFEKSNTISEAKINQVKASGQNARADECGKCSENHASDHKKADKTNPKFAGEATSTTKGPKNGKSKQTKHPKNHSTIGSKSTSSVKSKTLAYTKTISQCTIPAQPCTKQPEKKSNFRVYPENVSSNSILTNNASARLYPENVSSDLNLTSNASATQNSIALGLVGESPANCSNCSKSGASQDMKTISTDDQQSSRALERISSENASASTESSTTVFLASEMYSISSNVIKGKSSNAAMGENTSIKFLPDQVSQAQLTTEETGGQNTAEKEHHKHHNGNSSCPEKISFPKDYSKKYYLFFPTEQYSDVSESPEKVTEKSTQHHHRNNTCPHAPMPKDSLKKYQNFLPTENSSNVTEPPKKVVTLAIENSSNVHEALKTVNPSSIKNSSTVDVAPKNVGPTITQNYYNVTEASKKSGPLAEKNSSSLNSSLTKAENRFSSEMSLKSGEHKNNTTGKSVNLNESVKIGDNQRLLNLNNDSKHVSPSTGKTDGVKPATEMKENCSSKSADSVSTRLPGTTEAKWTNDKVNEGEKPTPTKFVTNSLLGLSGLDLMVNNLQAEPPLEVTTQNIINPDQLSNVDDILSIIKSEHVDNVLAKPHYEYDSDIRQETNFKKKEAMSTVNRNALIESKTVANMLENLNDFEPGYVNDVVFSSSNPVLQVPGFSKKLTQDEINNIIIASNQDVEIEPRLLRKRRKEANTENHEDDRNKSEKGSSNFTCPSESSEEKKTMDHRTPHPHTKPEEASSNFAWFNESSIANNTIKHVTSHQNTINGHEKTTNNFTHSDEATSASNTTEHETSHPKTITEYEGTANNFTHSSEPTSASNTTEHVISHPKTINEHEKITNNFTHSNEPTSSNNTTQHVTAHSYITPGHGQITGNYTSSTESSNANVTTKPTHKNSHETTQHHATSKKHWFFKSSNKKHDNVCKPYKPKHVSQYPRGPSFTDLYETCTQACMDDGNESSSTENVENNIETDGHESCGNSPFQPHKGNVSRMGKTESEDENGLSCKKPAREINEKHAFLPRSFRSGSHEISKEGVPFNIELHKSAHEYPKYPSRNSVESLKNDHFLNTDFGDLMENKKIGLRIENSRQYLSSVIHPGNERKQVDVEPAQENLATNNEYRLELASTFGECDDKTKDGASVSNPTKLSKSSQDRNVCRKEADDSAFSEILFDDNLPKAAGDPKRAPSRQFASGVFSERPGRKMNKFPHTRHDYFDDLEQKRLFGTTHPVKNIVKREAKFENPGEDTNSLKLNTNNASRSEQQGVCALNKSGDLGVQHSSAGEINDEISKGVLRPPGEMRTSANAETQIGADEEEKGVDKDRKNTSTCIKINPLSYMPSISTKLLSLKNVSNVSISAPLYIEPSVARNMSHSPLTGGSPHTAEDKLDVILKSLKAKLLPLIEDAEDKKLIEYETCSGRRPVRPRTRGRIDGVNTNKRKKRNTRMGRVRHFIRNSKSSDAILHKHDLVGSVLSNSLGVKRSHVPLGSVLQEAGEGVSEKVGYVPHYITDHVPMEKAIILDYKNGERNKGKEKCGSASLNKQCSRATDAHDSQQGANTKDSKFNSKNERSSSENCSFLELLSAIAADSIRQQSMEQKQATDIQTDFRNVDIDTPIYESEINVFENDYASFVEDEENEESEEIESLHNEKNAKKKSVVSKDSLSFYPVGSSESDYLDGAGINLDKKVQEKKQIEENRMKRNPHGGVRKNHLKINIPREGKIIADNHHQRKEKRDKREKRKNRKNMIDESNGNPDNDYITFQFAVEDKIGLSQLEADGELNAHFDEYSVDAGWDADRQKRQVLSDGRQVRGGQNCADRTTPPNVNCKTYHESAHCLRFSDLWYTVYKVGDPEIVQTIYLQVFEKHIEEDGSSQWEDHTHGEMISLSNSNPKPMDFLPDMSMEYHSLEDCSGPFSLNASTARLLIPQPVAKEKMSLYPQLQGGPGEYLVLDDKLVGADGAACDVAGIAYEGFAHQENRCGRPSGSCLTNQPVQFWRSDIKARMAGRKGCYFLENFGIVPSNPIKVDKNDEQFLALEYQQKQESFVEIELKADFNSVIRVGSSAQISEIYVDSTTPGVNLLTILVTNAGLVSSRYSTRVVDCPIEAPKEWSNVEGPLVRIAPQRDEQTQLTLVGDLPVESMHCSVEVLNEQSELVATRRFRFQLNDRCFCVWWCLCACIGTVDGLKCRPQSQQHHHAAGFEGGMPITSPPSGWQKALHGGGFAELSDNLLSTMLMVLVAIVLIMLLLGLSKALVGLICCPVVGAWGIFIMTFRPIRLKEYYEDELKEEEVVYDPHGYPVNPYNGYHNVRALSQPMQFLYNVVFFLLLPITLLGTICCWCVSGRGRAYEATKNESCNDNMCFDSYANDDDREQEATNYVLTEMQNSRQAITNYVDMDSENTPLVRSSSRPKMSPSATGSHPKAEKLTRSLIKQRITFRNMRAPIFGVEFPNDVPYCIRGHFLKQSIGYKWVSSNPLLQYWTYNGDLILMKHPKKLDASLFDLWYATPREIYDDNVLSKLPKGFCINVKFQDDVSNLGDEDTAQFR